MIPLRGAALTTYDHPYDVEFTPRYGWTCDVTILRDHRCFKLFPQFATWSKADHVRTALYALRASLVLERTYCTIAGDALRTFGDDGPLISGIVRDHFPTEVKDMLRSLAVRQTRQSDIGLAHWQASGRRFTTWRTERHRLRKALTA